MFREIKEIKQFFIFILTDKQKLKKAAEALIFVHLCLVQTEQVFCANTAWTFLPFSQHHHENNIDGQHQIHSDIFVVHQMIGYEMSHKVGRRIEVLQKAATSSFLFQFNSSRHSQLASD